MEPIIVGIDESACAAAALRWAAAAAAPTSTPVVAILAWGYLDQHHLEPDTPFEPTYAADVAEKVAQDLVTRALGEGHHVTARAVCDLPARAILEAGTGARMIVMGARGMGGFRGLLLGSVSRQVLHGADCPVVIVREQARPRPDGPVVVGVDGSGPARRALKWAAIRAREAGVPLHVVHAWHLPYTGLGYGIPWPDMPDQATEADHFLTHQLAEVDTTGLVVERRPISGRPGKALVEASAEASIVVVGSRGHGQLTGAVFGSVSDQVSHHAECPVAVIP